MLNSDTPLTFVVVHLKKRDGTTSHYKKIGILTPNISDGLSSKNIFYVRHGLETCSPFADVKRFPTRNNMNHSLVVSFRSSILFFSEDHSLLHIVDMSDTPTLGGRFVPFKMMIRYLLVIDEKIYIFGYKESWELSAYRFSIDLDKHEFHELSLPILDSCECRTVVISLGKKILTLHVDNQRQFIYDPRLQTWTPANYKDLLPHFCTIWDAPITVEEHNTFYWLDSNANIRAFDYQLCKHYFGSIVGLRHEPIVRGRVRGGAPLLHFRGRLFGIVWKSQDYLHLTLLHISPGPKAKSTAFDDDHLLFANVVSCSRHPIDSDLILDGAYKL